MDTATELRKVKADLELVARLLERSGFIDSLPQLPMRILRSYLPNNPTTKTYSYRNNIIEFPTDVRHLLDELAGNVVIERYH